MRFLDGTTSAGLGRRFRGSNRSGRYRWSRNCTIFTYDEPREFGYITSGGSGDATAWHFRLEPTAAGTRLPRAFQGVSMPLWLSRLVGVLIPAHDDRTEALRGDMVRLAAPAKRSTSAPPTGRRLLHLAIGIEDPPKLRCKADCARVDRSAFVIML